MSISKKTRKESTKTVRVQISMDYTLQAFYLKMQKSLRARGVNGVAAKMTRQLLASSRQVVDLGLEGMNKAAVGVIYLADSGIEGIDGRPAVGIAKRATAFFSLNLNPKQHEKLCRQARSVSLTLSEFIQATHIAYATALGYGGLRIVFHEKTASSRASRRGMRDVDLVHWYRKDTKELGLGFRETDKRASFGANVVAAKQIRDFVEEQGMFYDDVREFVKFGASISQLLAARRPAENKAGHDLNSYFVHFADFADDAYIAMKEDSIDGVSVPKAFLNFARRMGELGLSSAKESLENTLGGKNPFIYYPQTDLELIETFVPSVWQDRVIEELESEQDKERERGKVKAAEQVAATINQVSKTLGSNYKVKSVDALEVTERLLTYAKHPLVKKQTKNFIGVFCERVQVFADRELWDMLRRELKLTTSVPTIYTIVKSGLLDLMLGEEYPSFQYYSPDHVTKHEIVSEFYRYSEKNNNLDGDELSQALLEWTGFTGDHSGC